MKVINCIFIGLATVAVASAAVRYDGYQVYRVTAQNEDDVANLVELQNRGVNFWDGPSGIGKNSDILLAPHQQGDLLESIRTSGMNVEVYVNDVQALIDADNVTSINTNALGELTWDKYYQLPDIYAFLDNQAAKHSSHAQVVTYGKSSEGRDLKLIKISKSGETKPAVFIEANIHAREWITNAVATYVINEVLNGGLQSRLDNFDFYIVPVANPDGYEYTYSVLGNRLWRKTRSKTNSILGCKGADPNRNWEYKWRTGGSSTDPCQETYAGSEAFSEPETKLLAEYYNTIAKRVVFYFDIHSYSQYFLIPYGTSNDRISQYDEYMKVCNASATALSKRYGTKYTYGNIVDKLYVVSGGSSDWVKGVHNTPLVIDVELRDTGKYGFLLPASQITPCCEETLDALHVFLDHCEAEYSNYSK